MQSCETPQGSPLTGPKRPFSTDNLTLLPLPCNPQKHPKHFQSLEHLQKLHEEAELRGSPQGPLHRSWQPARLHWTLGSHQDCWAGTGLPCKPSSAASGLAFWLTTTPVFLPAPPGSISETNSRSFRGVQGKRQTGKVLRNSTALAELMISSAGSTLLPFNYCNLFALLLITREHHRSLSMLRLISQKDGTSPAALMLPACTLLLLCTHSWKTPCRC